MYLRKEGLVVYYILRFIYFYFVFVSVLPVSLSVDHMCPVPMRSPEEGIRPHETEVKVGVNCLWVVRTKPRF